MKPKILIHTCCAPCLAGVCDELKEKYELVCYFYNPNIQPFKEHQNRKAALVEFCKMNNISLICEDIENDNFANWFDFILADKNCIDLQKNRQERCQKCYEMRMMKLAKKAQELGIKNITTTLLFSIYQYHDLIKNLGNEIAKNCGFNFHYQNFRIGWKKGCEIYRETRLFRQNYCGCIFSEYERFGIGK